MLDPKILTTLPYDFLWMMATGYLAYRLAFVGRNSHHKVFDETLLMVVFATIARLAAAFFVTVACLPYVPAAMLGAVFTLALALAWRCWLANWARERLRNFGLVDHDGYADAWRSMLAADLNGPKQLVVVLKSGKSYLCDDLARFNTAPLGPCLWGEDGSIGMYVTAMRKQGEKWQDLNPERSIGYEMSFFKAAEIERIDITRGG